MNKLKLIIQHEYMTMVGKKSFIIMTLLIPFLILIVGCIPVLLAYINSSADTSITRIAVIDESGNYGSAFKDTPNYRFMVMQGDKAVNAREFYKNAGESIDAVMVIPANVLDDQQATIYSENTIDQGTISMLTNCLSDTLARAKIASFNDPDLESKIEQSQVSAQVKSIKWNEEGDEQEQSAQFASVLGMILSFLTYTFVLSYGAMIMNSVVEEKTNRIVEVIVSSCRPLELMMGKIIGVGLVGLTQFAIWVVLLGIGYLVLGLVAGGAMAVSNPEAITAGMNLPGGTDMASGMVDSTMSEVMTVLASINWLSLLGNFVIYFIGGYLLYASLFAGFGSAVDQASDSSQFTMPIILIMIIALYAGIACIENPSGPMAVWCSIIPFTSPVVMMVRLPFDVPWWQLLLSIVLLYATAFACIWLSARIYRTGILLYGKKRTFKEVLKWVK
ncbi:MAG: ABC transporter permease [Muribaculaceae bacterium]|nr:ABC transporter permease [Muribaculaceae bacterium]